MKTLVLFVVIGLLFLGLRALGNWPTGEGRFDGKPPDPLQRLHDTARLLRARVIEPLWGAAASRLEEGGRLHGGAGISSRGPDVKMPLLHSPPPRRCGGGGRRPEGVVDHLRTR